MSRHADVTRRGAALQRRVSFGVTGSPRCRACTGNAAVIVISRDSSALRPRYAGSSVRYTASVDIVPDQLTIAERYKLLIGCIVPRPIAFVSTVSPDGRFNLAPFSFFNGVGSNPMMVMFCPTTSGDGTDNDTLRNARPRSEGGTGEFVINAASEQYIREVSAAAEPLAYGDSEFELTGLKTKPSAVVAPPRVAVSPYCFECRTVQVVRTNPDKPASGNIVIGEVVHVFLRDDLVNERMHVDAAKLAAIGRMGGAGYCTTRDRFDLPRGKAALEGG